MEKLKYLLNIVVVALLLGAVAVGRDGRILGVSVADIATESNEVEIVDNVVGDVRIVESVELGKGVFGFAGRTPVRLHIVGDVIERMEVMENVETPSYVELVERSGFFDSWNGVTLSEAVVMKPDAVSGATMTSVAVMQNVQLAAAYAANVDGVGGGEGVDWSVKTVAGLLVLLGAVLMVFLKPKNKIWMMLQMALNVAVLGFWCGSFLSLAQLVSWMSNGFNFSLTLVAILMLVIVVVMPLFGKKGKRGTYCHLVCPMGSAQALLAKIPFTKIKLGAKLTKVLNNLRYYILAALLFVMWLGVGFDLLNYEVFPVFMPESASIIVIVMAVVFLLLSMFINKPYCRFVCPTGALITTAEKENK